MDNVVFCLHSDFFTEADLAK